jgi:hypothetical protein
MRPNRRNAIRIALSIGLLVSPLAACGRDQAQRGLSPPDETSTPESRTDMGETQAQRQEQVEKDMQQEQTQEFDASEQGAEKAEQHKQQPAQQ